MTTYSSENITQPVGEPAMPTETINPTTVAEVGTVVQEAANVASVATANPTYAADAAVGVALGNAIAQIINAANAPALSSAATQAAWVNMGASLGAALAAYHAAK